MASDRAYAHSVKLMCGWYWWQVMDADVLGVVIPHLHSPDMTGCIEVAKGLMPEVTKIYVFNDRVHADACETVYKLTRNGTGDPEWEAFDTRKIGL